MRGCAFPNHARFVAVAFWHARFKARQWKAGIRIAAMTPPNHTGIEQLTMERTKRSFHRSWESKHLARARCHRLAVCAKLGPWVLALILPTYLILSSSFQDSTTGTKRDDDWWYSCMYGDWHQKSWLPRPNSCWDNARRKVSKGNSRILYQGYPLRVGVYSVGIWSCLFCFTRGGKGASLCQCTATLNVKITETTSRYLKFPLSFIALGVIKTSLFCPHISIAQTPFRSMYIIHQTLSSARETEGGNHPREYNPKYPRLASARRSFGLSVLGIFRAPFFLLCFCDLGPHERFATNCCWQIARLIPGPQKHTVHLNATPG